MQTTKGRAQAPGQDDEREFFCAIYRGFAPSVLSYLRARGMEDPEALTQDVFLALYPRLGKLSGGMNGAKALVFSIAHPRCVDEYRRRSTAPLTCCYDPDVDARFVTSAEEQALAAESSMEAKALLGGLRQDQRDVLMLRVVADLSLETTAEIMGKTPGAIKQLQHRALARLRKLRPSVNEGLS